MSQRNLRLPAAALVGLCLCLSSCQGEPAPDAARDLASPVPSSAAARTPAPTPTTPTTLEPSALREYCRLSDLAEDQDGSPYDPETWGSTVRTMSRAADLGPPDLRDEWTLLIAEFRRIEAAVTDAGLAPMSRITLYEVLRASSGQGPWPPGVDRQAVEQLTRAFGTGPEEALERADSAISDHARESCPPEK